MSSVSGSSLRGVSVRLCFFRFTKFRTVVVWCKLLCLTACCGAGWDWLATGKLGGGRYGLGLYGLCCWAGGCCNTNRHGYERGRSMNMNAYVLRSLHNRLAVVNLQLFACPHLPPCVCPILALTAWTSCAQKPYQETHVHKYWLRRAVRCNAMACQKNNVRLKKRLHHERCRLCTSPTDAGMS